MSTHYAVVNSEGRVERVVVWDGISDYDCGDGNALIAIPYEDVTDDFDGSVHRIYAGGVGWDYVDGEFVDNRPVEEPETP